MSAEHRSLARLPLSIFTDLINDDHEYFDDNDKDGSYHQHPEVLRSNICHKLNQMTNCNSSKTQQQSSSSFDSITTVGQLLKMTPPALLRALDPLLTHRECKELIRRICSVCSARPNSALELLNQTTTLNTCENSTTSVQTPAKQELASSFNNNADKVIRHVPSGMEALDNCLKGGFRIGTITELVGRAGVGKTQLAMQLCVVAAKYGQGSVYIDTEKKLSLRRLEEIARERAKVLNNDCIDGNLDDMDGDVDHDGYFYYQGNTSGIDSANVNNNVVNQINRHHEHNATTGSNSRGISPHYYKRSIDVLENVTVHSPTSTSQLLSVISNIEEEILLRNDKANSTTATNPRSNPNEQLKFPVRLLILDSIAAPARRDFGVENAPQRVSAIFKVSQMLKQIADQFQVAVVVINQVGSMDGGSGAIGNEGALEDGSDFVSVTAALGISWHHCVSTRVLLEHERDPHRIDSSLDIAQYGGSSDNYIGYIGGGGEKMPWMSKRGHVRTATVVKSNVAGRSEMSFEVTMLGVRDLLS